MGEKVKNQLLFSFFSHFIISFHFQHRFIAFFQFFLTLCRTSQQNMHANIFYFMSATISISIPQWESLERFLKLQYRIEKHAQTSKCAKIVSPKEATSRLYQINGIFGSQFGNFSRQNWDCLVQGFFFFPEKKTPKCKTSALINDKTPNSHPFSLSP